VSSSPVLRLSLMTGRVVTCTTSEEEGKEKDEWECDDGDVVTW
jgi:hypothetical protein